MTDNGRVKHWQGKGWLAVSAGWILVLCIADALMGQDLIFPSLLLIAPVVVAARAVPSMVALVAGVAWIATLLLGFPDHYFMTERHVVTLIVTAAVGGLSLTTSRLHTRLDAALALSEFRARHDVLTGMLSRRAIRDAGTDLGRIRTPDRPELAVVMADIDYFKAVNDQHGHPIGDAVLVETGRRLRESLRAGDLVGRYGGEEFMLILTGPRAAVDAVVERVLTAFRSTPIATDAGALSVRLSIGLAAIEDDGLDAAIQRADAALYVSKRDGRDRITRWDDSALADAPGATASAAIEPGRRPLMGPAPPGAADEPQRE